MPPHTLHDEPRFCVVLELISGDVDDLAAQFKPRMGVLARIAQYVLRAAIALIVKILSKKQRGVPASPVGEVLQLGQKTVRLTLFNRGSKGDGEPIYLVALIVCEVTGNLFIRRGHVVLASESQLAKG